MCVCCCRLRARIPPGGSCTRAASSNRCADLRFFRADLLSGGICGRPKSGRSARKMDMWSVGYVTKSGRSAATTGSISRTSCVACARFSRASCVSCWPTLRASPTPACWPVIAPFLCSDPLSLCPCVSSGTPSEVGSHKSVGGVWCKLVRNVCAPRFAAGGVAEGPWHLKDWNGASSCTGGCAGLRCLLRFCVPAAYAPLHAQPAALLRACARRAQGAQGPTSSP